MTTRSTRILRRSAPSRRWRLGACLGLVALCLNLLVPLAVVASAAPADPDTDMCHVANGSVGGSVPLPNASSPNAPGPHHCPLCVALSGGVAASPEFAHAVAVLPPQSAHLQPYRLVPKLPPTPVRLMVPQPRAPPAVRV